MHFPDFQTGNDELRKAEGCVSIPDGKNFTISLQVHEMVHVDQEFANTFDRAIPVSATDAILCVTPNEAKVEKRQRRMRQKYEFGQRTTDDFLVFFERKDSPNDLLPWPETRTVELEFVDTTIEITFVRVAINVR